MESISMTFESTDQAYYTGNRQILGSFLSANTDNECFGSLRIPKSFCEAFTHQLSSNVIIKCKKIAWKAIFDQGKNRLYGLKNFMKFYKIKIYNLIQFDYYGEHLFVVSIYRDTAIECKYPTTPPADFFKNEDMTSFIKDQYVIDCSSMEYEKSHELWSFNAYKNCVHYFNINISKDDIDRKRKHLILSPELENLYKDWKDGQKLFLSFGEILFVIDVKMKDGNCMLRNGWYDLSQIINLQAGDTLVIFKLPGSENNRVNACLFEANNEVFNEDTVCKEWKRGFFKVVTEDFIDAGILVVPRQIKEIYNQKLINTRKIEVNGESWFICYNYIDGYVTNLKEMIHRFSLRAKDTIIFTMNRSKVMCARIYQEDGNEIGYANRKFEKSNLAISSWIWDVKCIRESDFCEPNGSQNHIVRIMESDGDEEEMDDEEMDQEEDEFDDNQMNNADITFDVCLRWSNVNHSAHGVHIPRNIIPNGRQWKAGEKVLLRTNNRSWQVGIVYNNGLPRFSAGWNNFAKDNELKLNQTLVFTFVEDENGIAFEIQLP